MTSQREVLAAPRKAPCYAENTPPQHICSNEEFRKAICALICAVVQVPNVARKEYSLLDITDDGYVSAHQHYFRFRLDPAVPRTLRSFLQPPLAPDQQQPTPVRAQSSQLLLFFKHTAIIETRYMCPDECNQMRMHPQVSLMDDSGNTKDDLKLPTGTDDADKLAKDIKSEFDDGKELIVTVVSVRVSNITNSAARVHFCVHKNVHVCTCMRSS